MTTKTRCGACDQEWPSDCIVRADEANTGGDTICYRCHVECVPEDVRDLAAGLRRCLVARGGRYAVVMSEASDVPHAVPIARFDHRDEADSFAAAVAGQYHYGVEVVDHA